MACSPERTFGDAKSSGMSARLKVMSLSDGEARRLAAVRRYDILDTPPDGSFDRITAIAARLFSVPISIISLVDHDRIWFKSHHGLEVSQIDRAPGLCASAILQIDPWILTDAKADPRSLTNPLVAGEFGLRFYAGAPLRTHDGYNLGTLCVIDREPRAITDEQIATLKDLAAVVIDEMELRLSSKKTVAELQRTIAERELMAKEVEHRVMNGLQLVSGMLRLQSRATSGDTAAQLSEAAVRVTAVGRVHQHLYTSDSIDRTDCVHYLRRLSSDLSGLLPGGITVQGEEAVLPTAQIVSLGLIVTELVTNAAKHGASNVNVTVKAREGQMQQLSVEDDGPGLPPDFDPAASAGFGMKVVRLLTDRLEGKLTFGAAERGTGSRFAISLR